MDTEAMTASEVTLDDIRQSDKFARVKTVYTYCQNYVQISVIILLCSTIIRIEFL